MFISFEILLPLEEKKEEKIGFFRNSEKLLALASDSHCYFPRNFKIYNEVSMKDMWRPKKICDLKIVQIKVTKVFFWCNAFPDNFIDIYFLRGRDCTTASLKNKTENQKLRNQSLSNTIFVILQYFNPYLRFLEVITSTHSIRRQN